MCVDWRGGDFIYYLLDFVVVACVGSGPVVGEGFRAGEFVVAGGGGDDVAVAGDLAGESGDGAGYLVDFGEEDDGGEAGVRVIGDCGVEEEDTWRFLTVSMEEA